jgi:RHS repeat-associated protein
MDGNIGGLEARVVYDPVNPTNPPQKYFYHYDGSGNVTAVTDDSQQTVAQYNYDAYGNLLNSSGAYASQNPWRFSTKYNDDGSGLYYYGYRFYSPGLGRWINRDPIAESGGLNLYGMTGNDPINLNDIDGRQFGEVPAAVATAPLWIPPVEAFLYGGAVIIGGGIGYAGNKLSDWYHHSSSGPKNKLHPDGSAVGPHSTFRPGHWETWWPSHPKNPKPWEPGQRGRSTGKPHGRVWPPLVHGPEKDKHYPGEAIPGGTRPARPGEVKPFHSSFSFSYNDNPDSASVEDGRMCHISK